MVGKDAVISRPQEVWRGDLTSLRASELDSISNDALEFSVSASAATATAADHQVMHGVCLWFSVGGRGDSAQAGSPPPRSAQSQEDALDSISDDTRQQHVMSTGPDDPPTHWKQTLIALPEPLLLSRSETRLRCALALRRGGGREGGGSQRCRQYLISLMVSQEPA